MNRLAIFSEEHGIRHLGAICLRRVFLVLSEDFVPAGRCFLLITAGNDIKTENFLTILRGNQDLLFDENPNFLLFYRFDTPCGGGDN